MNEEDEIACYYPLELLSIANTIKTNTPVGKTSSKTEYRRLDHSWKSFINYDEYNEFKTRQSKLKSTQWDYDAKVAQSNQKSTADYSGVSNPTSLRDNVELTNDV